MVRILGLSSQLIQKGLRWRSTVRHLSGNKMISTAAIKNTFFTQIELCNTITEDQLESAFPNVEVKFRIFWQ